MCSICTSCVIQLHVTTTMPVCTTVCSFHIWSIICLAISLRLICCMHATRVFPTHSSFPHYMSVEMIGIRYIILKFGPLLHHYPNQSQIPARVRHEGLLHAFHFCCHLCRCCYFSCCCCRLSCCC